MPIARFELPDGRIARFEVPEGTSPEQAQQLISSSLGMQPLPETPSVGSQLLGLPGEVAKGFVRGLAVDPVSGLASLGYSGLRSAGADIKPFEDTAFGTKLSEAQTYLAPDQGLISQFGGGLGSLLSFIPGGLLKGGAKVATLAGQAMGVGSEEARARAEQAALEGVPVSPEQQFGAQLGGTAIGITELAPIGKLIGPFKAIFGTMSKADAEKYAPGIFNSAKRMLETGGIEGFQEGMANILQDLNAKGIYNPNLSVGESALGDAAMGASVGAFAQGAVELVTRGKRTQQYEALKAQERREEAEKRMREIEENYLAQIQTTKDQLGIQPEVLALPAPQQEIQPFSEIDPLNNPLGKFTQEEVGADNLTAINEARQKKGLAQLDSLSIEDMVDAKTPQGEIDRVLAYKTGYDGTVELAPDDVMNVAQSKNIDTTTQGFNDFLRRTTGIDNLKKMSQPQLFSAFKALDSLNASETLQVLPEGTNATRFTEQQYENAFKALESKMGEESIPLADALREVKKSTGLKSVQDADALIQTAIRNGEIDAVAAPRYDVVDGNGKVIRTYLKRESAEAAAAKEGFSVRESTSINLQYAGKQAEIANAPTIREVNLQTGVEPQAFEIRSPDKVLASVKSEKEAAQKAERMAAVREGNAQRIEKQIQKEQAKIAGNQRRLEQMEAEGEGDTIKFKKLAAELDAQNKQNAEKIAQLEAQAQAARAPLQVVPKGEKPTAKKGFAVESPVGETGALTAPRKELGTFPTREAAEQAAIANMPDDALQALYDSASAARGVIPKRLANNARKELESRGLSGKSALLRAPTPTGIPVSFKGTREQAEKTLAEAGVFTRQVRDQVKELEARLRPVMDKLGLKNMRLNILRSIESEMGTADGYYFQKLIAISLDAPNPIRTLRHEGIHALKELGAFTPEQWKVLEDRARKEWVEKYKTAQRYRGLDQESILEEAIADAFSDFDQTKPPAGLIGTLFRNIKQFLEALRNAFRGMGFNTADSVFEQVEAGRMTPRDIEATGGMKFSQNFEDSANLTPLDVESAKFYERELEGLIKKVGNRIAGMKSDQTIADVRKAVKKLQSYTAQGLEGKDWYERSAKAVLEAFNGDKVLAEKFFQIIAITSANTEVKANFTGAYKAWSQFAKGQPIKVGVATKNQNIDALLNFGEDWNGRKTNTFYTNLMEAMEGKDSGRSTIDLHMTRMIFDQDAPTDAQYELAENMVRLMASKIGLAPRQVQAASWVTQKAKSLFDYYRRKGWKKKFSDQELRAYVMEMAITDYSHLMKAKVKELPITPELQELSSKIRSRVQNITGEVIPSRESEMSQAEELKFADKERLTKKILNDKVIQDIAKSLGITSKIRVTVGAGAYAGKVNPNLIVQVVNADPEVAAKDTNDLSNAMSYVFKQDASPYFRADPALVKKEQFGYLFKFEKPLTPAKLKNINQILINKFGTITASGFSKVRPNEIVLINFRGQEDSISDRKFVNGIKNVLNEINEINPIQSKEAFGAQSEYPYHGWSADPDGNAIVTRLQNSRPELRNIQRRLNNFRESFVGELRGAIRATGGIPRFSLRPDELAGGPSTSGRVDAGRDGRGRPAGRSLAPLEGAPVIEGATGPDPRLVAVAEKYAADNNIPYRRQAKYVTVDENFAKRIAQAYEEMRHDPYNPRVIAAYDDLIRQTFAQYQALVDAGYEFTFFDSSSDPYQGNPWNAMRDLRANKRMAVYGTYDGYGTSGISSVDLEENPLLADTGLVWQDQYGVPRQVTANDLFRAVHDAFGHGLEGAGFRVRGEENAYQAHARLFTGPALEALTSETRGQNSWLNYGPYGEQNQTAKVFDTVFAEQKIGIMPSWTWTENIVPDEGDAPRYSLKEGITLGERQPGAVTVDAVHYGKEKVFTLSGNKYGTGIKGAEAERLRYATDPRIKRRVYFYAPTEFNRMKAPEGGLGNHVYVQKFDNILPPGKDMARLYREAGRDDNAFESAVVDAGYDGYYVPSMGMMVILNHDVPVEYRGTRQEMAARPEAESIKIGDKRYSLRQTNTPEFKRWFGDSKVVDEDGKPLVVYHGSQNAYLTEFEQDRIAYFTDNKTLADAFADRSEWGESLLEGEIPTTYDVYLSIKNPLFITSEEQYEMVMMDTNANRSDLIKQGYDGIIYKPKDGGSNYYAVFNPTQIKSASDNKGTFDQTNPDIRYSLRDDTNTPEFKKWFGKSTLVDEKGKPEGWYHGTARDITTFVPKQAGAIFVTKNPDFTRQFGGMSEQYIAEEIYNSMPIEEQYKRLMKAVNDAVEDGYLLPAAKKQMKASFDEMAQAGDLKLDQDGIPSSIQSKVRNRIAKSDLMPSMRNTMKLFVRAEKPFDYENNEHIADIDKEILNIITKKYQPKSLDDAKDLATSEIGNIYLLMIKGGDWNTIENPIVQEAIKNLGFDSFYVEEGGEKNLGLYDPNQLKSAIGNIGTFSRSNNDIRYALALGAIEPQTPVVPDVGGNPDGILGYAPEALGGKPIRLLVGTHNDIEDKGYGANHILNRILKDPKREPEGSEELLEKVAKTAQNTAGQYFRIFKDSASGAYVFYNGRNALITSQRPGEFSVVSMFKQDKPEQRWGRPIWTGKAPSMPAAFTRPVRGRTVLGEDGRVVPVPVKSIEQKKRIAITPSMVTAAMEEVEAPQVKGTLGLKKKMALREFKLSDMPTGKETETAVYTMPEGTRLYHGSNADNAAEIKKSGYYLLADPSYKASGGTTNEGYLVWFGDKAQAKGFASNEIDSMSAAARDKKEPGTVFSSVTDAPLKLVHLNNYKINAEQAKRLNEHYSFPDYKKFSAGDSLGIVTTRLMNHTAALDAMKSYETQAGRMYSASKDVAEILGFDGYYHESGVAIPVDQWLHLGLNDEGEFTGKPMVRYSIREQMDPATVDAIERTTTSRQEKGLAERMAEAISPTAFAKFRQGMINKYESIERLSGAVAKQYGDNELLADQSAIAAALFSDRAAGVAASSFRNGVPIYKNGFTTVSDFDGQVKGLIPILEPLMQRNDPFVFQAFQFYAATRRGKRLTAEGREKLFTADDLRRGAALESQFPEFKQVFDEYQKYNKGLVDYMKDTGVLSDKEAEIWTQNWDYIPFYRQMDGESTAGPNVFSAISGVSKPKKLKGGEEALADFVETVVRNSRAAIEAGMKNVAAQRVARDIVRIGQGQQVPASVARGNDIMTVKENGKTVYYQVDDPLLVESVKSLNLPNLPFLDLLSMPTRALRELVTKDPGFMLANLMRDSLQAWVTTGVSMKPIADTFKQYGKTLAGMSPEAKALAQAGLFTGYDFAGDVRGTAESVQKELRRRAGVVSPTEMAMWPITKVWDALDKGSTASDVATRAEVYKRTLEETGNEAEAMYQAMEVMNFSRKGNSALIRVLTSLVPFMNARIQGLDVLYRAAFGRMPSRIRERQQKAFITRSMTIMAMSMMYWMLASDEEEYKNAEQEVRDNYWIIGNVRIPIPFEIGTLFKVFPERILEYTFGQDTGKDLKDSIVRNLTSTLAVNPIPQAFLPALENLANYSVFTGQPIVGMGMRDVAAPYQATPSTSLLAQEVGEMFNYSPMKVDNLIRGYTGTIGTYAVMAIDSIMRNEGHPTKAAMGIEQTPVLKRFFASDLGTGNISAYYDMKQKVEEATRTINFLERTGNLQDLQEYMQGKGAKMLALKPYVSVLEKDMTMIRDTRRAIQASKMDPDQKREVLDNLRRAENALTSRIRYVQKSMSQS